MNKSSGNVLFLILIAVALFAALSYAVTSASRTGGDGNTSTEMASAQLAALQSHISAVQNAIQRLQISKNCTDTQLSFEPPPYNGSGGYTNSSSPTDKRCHVLHPDGGGVSAAKPSASWIDQAGTHFRKNTYYYASGFNFPNLGGTSAPELTLIVPYIKKPICDLVNKKIGWASPPTRNINASYPMIGTYNFSASYPSPVSEQPFACVVGDMYGNGEAFYHLYYVLKVR